MLILYYSYVSGLTKIYTNVVNLQKKHFSRPKINKPTTRLCIHDLAESHGLNKMCFTSNLCEKSLWRQKFVTKFLKTGQQKFLKINWRYVLSFFVCESDRKRKAGWEKKKRVGKLQQSLEEVQLLQFLLFAFSDRGIVFFYCSSQLFRFWLK